MTSTADNRKKFISGLINFMEHYGFDGVDLDWEYPQADDRGGITADKANYVALAKDLRAAFGKSRKTRASGYSYDGTDRRQAPAMAFP